MVPSGQSAPLDIHVPLCAFIDQSAREWSSLVWLSLHSCACVALGGHRTRDAPVVRPCGRSSLSGAYHASRRALSKLCLVSDSLLSTAFLFSPDRDRLFFANIATRESCKFTSGMLFSPWHRAVDACSRAGVMLWITSSCPEDDVVLTRFDTQGCAQ